MNALSQISLRFSGLPAFISTRTRLIESISVRLPRQLQLALAVCLAAVLAGCAISTEYSSGRLARVTPTDFITINPDHIIVGVDMDSRVPASFNRAPDFRVAVFPVDHNAWEPIGGRLKMRPLMLIGETPDKGAGERMKEWIDSPPGRLRLSYVLTDDAKAEMVEIQQKFDALLKQYPPGGANKGVLRLGADARWLVGNDPGASRSVLQTWLQLQPAEGPFKLWEGPIQEMR